MTDLRWVRSFLGHSGLAEAGKKNRFEQGADFRHPEISHGPSAGDARITTVDGQPAGFREFR
jgi:hypothetical protein